MDALDFYYDMVDKVTDEFVARYGIDVPTIEIIDESNEYPLSTGWTNFNDGADRPATRIVMKFGRNPIDARHQLLHELAHVYAGPDANHYKAFYNCFLRILDDFNADMSWAVQREMDYKPRAAKVLMSSPRYHSWKVQK